MRVLFVCVLAASLVGCATHPETTAVRKPAASKVASHHAKAIRSKQARTVLHTGTTTPSSQRADQDTERARAAIGAMLDNPASAEFSNMRRAQRNLLSSSVDTICGYVRVRGGSGGRM